MATRARCLRTHRPTARRCLSSARSQPATKSKFSPALRRQPIASLLVRAPPTAHLHDVGAVVERGE
eukprot:7518932-Pyramimonas_sp.AAC.1